MPTRQPPQPPSSAPRTYRRATGQAWTARSTNPGPADSFERTLCVSLPAAETAGVHHAHVTEREVEPNGIERIDRPEGRGNLRSHLPSGRGVLREPQASPEPDHVRVERHDQFGCGDPGPRPQID